MINKRRTELVEKFVVSKVGRSSRSLLVPSHESLSFGSATARPSFSPLPPPPPPSSPPASPLQASRLPSPFSSSHLPLHQSLFTPLSSSALFFLVLYFLLTPRSTHNGVSSQLFFPLVSSFVLPPFPVPRFFFPFPFVPPTMWFTHGLPE